MFRSVYRVCYGIYINRLTLNVIYNTYLSTTTSQPYRYPSHLPMNWRRSRRNCGDIDSVDRLDKAVSYWIVNKSFFSVSVLKNQIMMYIVILVMISIQILYKSFLVCLMCTFNHVQYNTLQLISKT